MNNIKLNGTIYRVRINYRRILQNHIFTNTNRNALCYYHLKEECLRFHSDLNPLPVQFKAVLRGQKGCVFFSGHLNLPTTPEIGLPSREKNHNN